MYCVPNNVRSKKAKHGRIQEVNGELQMKRIHATRVTASREYVSWRICPRQSNTPPQIDTRPNSAAKCLTLGEGKALVSASATISAVGQKTSQREPSSMIQRIKWNRISMCLVRA